MDHSSYVYLPTIKVWVALCLQMYRNDSTKPRTVTTRQAGRTLQYLCAEKQKGNLL